MEQDRYIVADLRELHLREPFDHVSYARLPGVREWAEGMPYGIFTIDDGWCVAAFIHEADADLACSALNARAPDDIDR